jgi:hypothetical protein
MKKYSEIAPIVKNSIKKLNTETERTFAVKDIENILSKHNVSSISELPLSVKAQIMNGK